MGVTPIIRVNANEWKFWLIFRTTYTRKKPCFVPILFRYYFKKMITQTCLNLQKFPFFLHDHQKLESGSL